MTTQKIDFFLKKKRKENVTQLRPKMILSTRKKEKEKEKMKKKRKNRENKRKKRKNKRKLEEKKKKQEKLKKRKNKKKKKKEKTEKKVRCRNDKNGPLKNAHFGPENTGEPPSNVWFSWEQSALSGCDYSSGN